MNNKRMAEKLAKGEAIDVSKFELSSDDYYIVTNFIDGVDYCNAETEAWIWSIGKNRKTGQILASHDTIFYMNPAYECLWLR